MKQMICKMRGCPRLVTAPTSKGAKPFAECNQQMPDTSVYWIECEAVSREWCKELRNAIKEMREVRR